MDAKVLDKEMSDNAGLSRKFYEMLKIEINNTLD
jgi:hypothetical protein